MQNAASSSGADPAELPALAEAGISGVKTRVGMLFEGASSEAPFDVIFIEGAYEREPEALHLGGGGISGRLGERVAVPDQILDLVAPGLVLRQPAVHADQGLDAVAVGPDVVEAVGTVPASATVSSGEGASADGGDSHGRRDR